VGYGAVTVLAPYRRSGAGTALFRDISAFHDMTGVKRAWRGRGVAGALKRVSIAWAREQGYERLVTSNELRNEAIRRLNTRLGYREEPGHLVVRGPLFSG
jgi:GNAT superfamily N-acetyltransferase